MMPLDFQTSRMKRPHPAVSGRPIGRAPEEADPQELAAVELQERELLRLKQLRETGSVNGLNVDTPGPSSSDTPGPSSSALAGCSTLRQAPLEIVHETCAEEDKSSNVCLPKRLQFSDEQRRSDECGATTLQRLQDMQGLQEVAFHNNEFFDDAMPLADRVVDDEARRASLASCVFVVDAKSEFLIMAQPWDKTSWPLQDRGVRRAWTALSQLAGAWLSVDGLWRQTGSDPEIPPQALLSYLILDAAERFRFQRIVSSSGVRLMVSLRKMPVRVATPSASSTRPAFPPIASASSGNEFIINEVRLGCSPCCVGDRLWSLGHARCQPLRRARRQPLRRRLLPAL